MSDVTVCTTSTRVYSTTIASTMFASQDAHVILNQTVTSRFKYQTTTTKDDPKAVTLLPTSLVYWVRFFCDTVLFGNISLAFETDSISHTTVLKVGWMVDVKLDNNDNNNNIYLLQLGCHPVTVVILHVNKTWNRLLLNLSPEGYMRSM